jgi:hypothetical protein
MLDRLFSPPRGESGYPYPILEAKKEYSHYEPYPAELAMKHEISRPEEVAWDGRCPR